MTSKEIVAQLTLEEKASLCSGSDSWHLEAIERLGLPPVMVTDGPHGLRTQGQFSDPNMAAFVSVKATCFPAACATSCSFDRELLVEIGKAMGEECLKEEIAVILGPAANIKRSPLCGRNFEYISEDPYVVGEFAAALIKGIQSQGIGTSLKHYAANNQETRRLTSSSVVDERALREIYLAGFERAVKKSQPWTLMCSYNMVNGTYSADNKKLLSDILRDEWGFQGLVMTDWGAVNDRVQGIRAGLDLEMPSSGGINDAKIVEAVKNGALDMAALDKVAVRLVDMILKAKANVKPGFTYNLEAHHKLARKAAAESAVLLKNDGNILPLPKGKTVAVIGAFGKTPRYQGGGSSNVNPHRIDNPFDELTKAGAAVEFAPGYVLSKEGGNPDNQLIREAAELAKKKDIALVFAGLPDEYESEGYDRTSMDMPQSHIQLIEAVAQANPNTVVVLQVGSPVTLPWLPKVKGLLLLYLGGQAAGGGTADLLIGVCSPGGKLAESWPLALEDNPSYKYFPGGRKTVEYRESVFVGYRYYNTVEKPVAFPFGYGLSYTTFEYADLKLERPAFKSGEELKVSLTVKNTGKWAGAEIVQIYVAPEASKIFRPKAELKGYERVQLESGESKTITLTLDTRSFAYYNTPNAGWAVEGGNYSILAGASSRDIRLRQTLAVTGDGKESALAGLREKAPDYFALKKDNFSISDAAFEALYGQPLPPSEHRPGDPFTSNSTLGDVMDNPIGQALVARLKEGFKKAFGGGDTGEGYNLMVENMMKDMPLRTLNMMDREALPPNSLQDVLALLNGKNPANPEVAKALGLTK